MNWAAKVIGPASSACSAPQRRTAKTTREGQGPWFSFVSCEMQGWRNAMEDAVVCQPVLGDAETPDGVSLFAVFDGHGGHQVSAYAASRIVDCVNERISRDEGLPGPAIRNALLDIEDELRKQNSQLIVGPSGMCGRHDYVGCTATVALLSRTFVVCCNVGDSRIFKCRKGECVPLTRDHKPESPRERKRIEAAGGTVVKMGPCYRVDCNLNLSRSLADFKYMIRI